MFALLESVQQPGIRRGRTGARRLSLDWKWKIFPLFPIEKRLDYDTSSHCIILPPLIAFIVVVEQSSSTSRCGVLLAPLARTPLSLRWWAG